MRRKALALTAGILLAMLWPGAALAVPVRGVLDQSNNPAGYSVGSSAVTAQTFTAARSGPLTAVDLQIGNGGPPTNLSVMIETLSSGQPSGTGVAVGMAPIASGGDQWVTIPLSPVTIKAGDQAAVVFTTGSFLDATGSGNSYSGGAAMMLVSGSWGPIPSNPLQDFAFRTYVDPQTTTVTLDKTQVVAGTTTPLSVTETFVYPPYQFVEPAGRLAPAAAPPPVYAIATSDPPSWYLPGPSPTIVVTCSSQVASTDCTISKLTTGVTPTQDGNAISVAVTGVASPTAADIGTTATITGTGTAQYPNLGPDVRPALGETLFSVVGSGSVTVVAAGTPPPTTTIDPARHDTDQGPIGLLLVLAGLASAIVVLIIVRRGLARR